jgi:uroporphyrinogen-III synthase
MRLLVTRPETEAARTVAALRIRGHEIVQAPAINIETVANAKLPGGPWSAVLVTSSNSLAFVANHPRRAELVGLPLFAVGRRTAEAAKAAGFASVSSADGAIGDLIRLLVARFQVGKAPMLYLAGEDRAGDLVGILAKQGVRVETVVVYRAVAIRQLPEEARAALANGLIQGILHYSRRSAEIFVMASAESGVFEQTRDAVHFCLSKEVARPLTAIHAPRIQVATRPEESSLFELLIFAR